MRTHLIKDFIIIAKGRAINGRLIAFCGVELFRPDLATQDGIVCLKCHQIASTKKPNESQA